LESSRLPGNVTLFLNNFCSEKKMRKSTKFCWKQSTPKQLQICVSVQDERLNCFMRFTCVNLGGKLFVFLCSDSGAFRQIHSPSHRFDEVRRERGGGQSVSWGRKIKTTRITIVDHIWTRAREFGHALGSLPPFTC